MNEPESIKVVLVGESGVGKTSIIQQFTSGQFDPHRETSLSAQFVSKTVKIKIYLTTSFFLIFICLFFI